MNGSLVDVLQRIIASDDIRVEIRRGTGESAGGARLRFVHTGRDHTLSACIEIPAEVFSLTADFEVVDLKSIEDPACPATHLVATVEDWFVAGSAPQLAGRADPRYRALRRDRVLAFFRAYDLHPAAPVAYSLTYGDATMKVPLDGSVSFVIPWERIIREHPLGMPEEIAASIGRAILDLQAIADSPAYGLREFRRRPRAAA